MVFGFLDDFLIEIIGHFDIDGLNILDLVEVQVAMDAHAGGNINGHTSIGIGEVLDKPLHRQEFVFTALFIFFLI